jgi:hypothetical protein
MSEVAMAVFLDLLGALLRVAAVPVCGYLVLHFARRWPWVTVGILVLVVVAGIGAVTAAAFDGYNVQLDTRNIEFHSEMGRWCFAFGGLALILGFPALPLVVIARAQNGTKIGPVGAQWAGVPFGYFMACFFCSAAFYAFLTGITK